MPMPVPEGDQPWYLEAEQVEIRDSDESTFKTALQVVRHVFRDNSNASFRISRRRNRFVGLHGDDGTIVPNIFQLSSGESSLLNLFLSILRDFEWSGSKFSTAADIRGIVVVDEIDLHLHAIHQNEILPKLIRMFPGVQFVVTTHSPLFVLGMNNIFGEDGFALYRLPQGHQISPEEFSEFGDAYRALTTTSRYASDLLTAINKARRPIVFVEGTTDQEYLKTASKLLSRESVIERFEIREGGGEGNLTKIWKDSVLPLTETLPERVLLLFDCDKVRARANRGKLFQRSIPLQPKNPIKKGIENLFCKETLEKARQHKLAFIDIDPARTKTVRGELRPVPEKWTVNEDEKANLCNWLCENGTQEDFVHFLVIFDLIEEVLNSTEPGHQSSEPDTTP